VLKEEKEVLGEKSAPVPYSSPQISSSLTRDRSQAYEMKININIVIQLVLHEKQRLLPLARKIGEY
jgi:hypothetical protein